MLYPAACLAPDAHRLHFTTYSCCRKSHSASCPVPALRKLREGRGTPILGSSAKIKDWATRLSPVAPSPHMLHLQGAIGTFALDVSYQLNVTK